MKYIDDQKDLEDYNTVDINIEAEEKEQDENTDNYPNLSIKIEQAQYSIFELKRKYDKDRICIDPDFQRNLVWTNKQKSELIESVIMQIPLPLIYLAENEDGKLVVVDGRQRLTTFFQFLDNEFRLKDLKILPQINGMNFNELEESHLYSRYVTIIEDTQLVVQIIKYPTKDRVRFDIFDRVNRGGTPLNKQEMRNALYQGNATKLLDELSKMKSFKDATGGAISPKHMKDKYVILRALCFYLLWRGNILDKNKKRMEYRSDMEELLGAGMNLFNKMDLNSIFLLKQLFDRTMTRAYQCLGKDGFRIPSNGKIRRPISMTLFETLFYYFTCFDKTSVSNLEMKKGVVELLQDEEYLRSLQHSVDSSVNVKKRFGKVKEKYKEIINRW
ncbi:DUF262 domain-containing protein [Anaerostipes hadrus]|nr:DUF262 domain-containing protein [Anaerostipes hadrus]